MSDVKEWFNRSSKTMGNGHIRMPLFDMIDCFHCIIDVLHLFLRISDVLFELLMEELIMYSKWETEVKPAFLAEMARIGVTFHIWKDDKGKLGYTSHDGP